MTIRLACPSCKTACAVGEELCGKTVRCGACQKAFQVPPRAAAPAAPAAKATPAKKSDGLAPAPAARPRPTAPAAPPRASRGRAPAESGVRAGPPKGPARPPAPRVPGGPRPDRSLRGQGGGKRLLWLGGGLAVGAAVIALVLAFALKGSDRDAQAHELVAQQGGEGKAPAVPPARPQKPAALAAAPAAEAPKVPAQVAELPAKAAERPAAPEEAPAGPADALSPKALAAIKRATVYVKVDVKGLSASGSGFVIHAADDMALVVTNHHVIEPKVEILVAPRPGIPVRPRGRLRPPPLLPPTRAPRAVVMALKNATVSVVFDSGTPSERIVKAEVLSADPERDLAVLRVRGVNNPPAPIDLAHAPPLAETMPVYTFGFPFGKVLATGKGHPAITVGKATISSLRQDDKGELAVVQIDGSLNPGNSGGPVTDARGRLVGVAVATIRNSSGIGLAIPGADVRKMLGGRLGAPHLTGGLSGGKVRLNVEIGLIDPWNKIRAVTLHCVPAGAAQGRPAVDTLEALPGCRKVPLRVEKQVASGTLTLDVDGKENALLLQAVYDNGAGKDARTRVVRHELKPEAVAKVKPGPQGQPAPKAGKARILGGAFDPVFEDVAPDGGVLVGFEVGLGKFFNSDRVSAVRPLFRTARGEIAGKAHGTDFSRSVTVKARPGYAVGAISVKAGLLVDGFSVTFMRVAGDALDPRDAYKSEWLGGKGGGRETDLGGDGRPAVGIVGKANNKDCTGLGLLLKEAPGRPAAGARSRATPRSRHGTYTGRLTDTALPNV